MAKYENGMPADASKLQEYGVKVSAGRVKLAKYWLVVLEYANSAPKSLTFPAGGRNFPRNQAELTAMPISGNTSYVPTMNEFIAHWGQVNAVLTPDLTAPAPDGTAMDLAGFTALRDNLQDQFQTVIGFLNDKEIARGGIRLTKARMLAHFNEFNAMLDGYWAGTAFINARPYAPSLSDGMEHFLNPMRDAYSLWVKVDAAPAPPGITLPLVLSDGTSANEFIDEINELQAAYAAEALANQNAVLARSERDGIMATAKAVMVSYRKVVPPRCAQHPTLVETLPAVTPPPGHTPQPVNASAVFQAPDQAKIVYGASQEATLARYELRGNPGEEYEDEDAVTIATHGPGDPLEFVTGFGLTQPGTQASYKVYVVLETGNEAGSAAMTVERPL